MGEAGRDWTGMRGGGKRPGSGSQKECTESTIEKKIGVTQKTIVTLMSQMVRLSQKREERS